MSVSSYKPDREVMFPLGIRQPLDPWSKAIVTALFVIAAAGCGSELPTAPRIATPPTVPAPPAPVVDVDWAALARLFDDPLYRDMPRLLENQQDAARLNAAVSQLVTGIRNRNIEMVRDALSACADGRQSYLLSPSYHPRERSLLIALSLIEMRGRAFVPGTPTLTLEGPTMPLEAGR